MRNLEEVKCPKCGAPLRESPRSYCCSKWREGCDFTIWKESYGHAVTLDEAIAMAEGKKIGPFNLKSKEGREYTDPAYLYYSEPDGRVKLEFPPRERK